MIKLQKEIEDLNDKLFLDDITKTFNKKWIYNKFLNEDAEFRENGICVLDANGQEKNIIDFILNLENYCCLRP